MAAWLTRISVLGGLALLAVVAPWEATSQSSVAPSRTVASQLAPIGDVPDDAQLTSHIDRAEGDASVVVVTGYVFGSEPTVLNVSSGDASLYTTASTRRFDVEAALGGGVAWGFVAQLHGALDSTVCIRVGDEAADCAWFRCSPVFPKGFRAALRDEFPGQRFTAYVEDTRTGCVYELNRNLQITTASVLKVEILGGILLEAQRERRELTTTEKRNIDAMMHLSLNPETGTLWIQVGGVVGMMALDAEFGAEATTQVHPFGATWSTAKDRTAVVQAVLNGKGPLGGSAVEQAWKVMTGVHRTQQWGISAGVAEGYTVAHKNGFYPYTGYGWRLGSSGFVADPGGGGYAITIMTDNNDIQADGISLVETIAEHVSTELTNGRTAKRPYDEVDCITHTGGGTWRGLTRELGLPEADWNDVRLAAGGDGPLRGQSVCVP